MYPLITHTLHPFLTINKITLAKCTFINLLFVTVRCFKTGIRSNSNCWVNGGVNTSITRFTINSRITTRICTFGPGTSFGLLFFLLAISCFCWHSRCSSTFFFCSSSLSFRWHSRCSSTFFFCSSSLSSFFLFSPVVPPAPVYVSCIPSYILFPLLRACILQMYTGLFCFCSTTSLSNNHASCVKYFPIKSMSTF